MRTPKFVSSEYLEYDKSSGDEFSRVEEFQWIQSLLDLSHHLYRFSVLGAHVVNITCPDTMLTGASPSHFQSPLNQTIIQLLKLLQIFCLVGWIDQEK